MVSGSVSESTSELETRQFPGATGSGGDPARLVAQLRGLTGQPVTSPFQQPLQSLLTGGSGAEDALAASISKFVGAPIDAATLREIAPNTLGNLRQQQASQLGQAFGVDVGSQLQGRDLDIRLLNELIGLSFPQTIAGQSQESSSQPPDPLFGMFPGRGFGDVFGSFF